MIELIQASDRYGLPLIFLFIVIWFYSKSSKDCRDDRERNTKDNREERRQWRESMEKISSEQINCQKESSEVIRQLTKVISESNK